LFNWPRNKKLKREFQEKILEHIDSLYNVALHMTKDKQNAQDLVQETALRAYRFFHRFEAGTNFKAWVMTVLRNIYINDYRKKIKEPAHIEFEEVEDFISLPQINGAQEEIFSETMQSLINELPQDLTTTLTLFYVDSFSYKEIAQIMSCPIGTVMSRLYTARQILKRQLSKYVEEEKGRIKWTARD